MQNAETVLDVIRASHRIRGDVITGEQGAGKLACPVREGADGKGPGNRDLAGGLLHLMRGGWKRGSGLGSAEPAKHCMDSAGPLDHRASLLLYLWFRHEYGLHRAYLA